MSQYKLYFRLLEPTDLGAPQMVLSLLSAGVSRAHGVSELVAAGEVFGMEPGAVRMALTRLVKERRVEMIERGIYRLGPSAALLNDYAIGWRSKLERVREWGGSWLGVVTGHLGKRNRKSFRERERALRLYGFAEADGDLWVRPDNLEGSLPQMRANLCGLGLEDTATVLHIDEWLHGSGSDWTRLWPVETFAAAYEEASYAILRSRSRMDGLELAAAARESFLIGQSVIRTINLDPLLPEEIADHTGFVTMVQNMEAYDQVGRAIWKEFFEIHRRLGDK